MGQIRVILGFVSLAALIFLAVHVTSDDEITVVGKASLGMLSPKKPADSKIKKFVDIVKMAIREKICTTLKEANDTSAGCAKMDSPLKAEVYKDQMVIGTGVNYFIALGMDDKTYHVKLYEQKGKKPVLVEAIGPKKKTEDIRVF